MLASAARGNVGTKLLGAYDAPDADVPLAPERVRDFLRDVNTSVDADGV